MKFTDDWYNSYAAFLVVFGLYFIMRFIATAFSYYEHVLHRDIWRSQATWFMFGFTSLVGMLFAIATKTGLTKPKWTTTGSNSNLSWLEWFNIIYFWLLMCALSTNVVFIFTNAVSCFQLVASTLFGGAIAMMMWPGVSMSLYQRLPFEFLQSWFDKRIEIPTHATYAAVVLVGMVISQLALTSESICSIQDVL